MKKIILIGRSECGKDIFCVSSYTGEGIWKILQYLREPGDILPWENKKDAEKPRSVLTTKPNK